MGRQRPATDTFRAISAGTLERLDRAAQQHQQALKRFLKKGIGNRGARGTADSHPCKIKHRQAKLHHTYCIGGHSLGARVGRIFANNARITRIIPRRMMKLSRQGVYRTIIVPLWIINEH
jgi:hypothetical protein